MRKEIKEEMKTIVKYLLPALVILIAGLMFSSCGATKNVPVQYIDKIEYRDSIVFIHDTVTIEIPKEIVKEVVPQLDTSYLKTSVAESVAYLDTTKRQIHHTLEQKGQVKVIVDTIVKVQYVDRYVYQDVPVEVEVIKYRRDALFWVLVGWAALCILYAVIKLYVRV